MNCPICKKQKPHIVMQTYDDRYGYPGLFTLMRCQHCKHEFLDINLSPTQLIELYTNFYPRKSFDIANYKPHVEQKGFFAWFNGLNCSAFRWVPKNVRVLDVGCGFGESLGYHTARGCDVYGVEADENIRRVVEKFGYKVHVGLFDDKLYEQDFFDFITMDQVIEHVTDPLVTLRGAARILKPGGTVILSTPNAQGWGARLFRKRWINWHSPYHLQFFTLRSMQMAAEQAGLVVEKTATITPSAWLHFQWIHLLSFPPEGKPSKFWAPGGKWSLIQTIALIAISIINRCKINHMVTRFFDELDAGDNRLYFLRKP
jgi:2-polyprenyl-3-methyl-5-hydroxy-6-metoxy-1,4-benzoquinol methylase